MGWAIHLLPPCEPLNQFVVVVVVVAAAAVVVVAELLTNHPAA